jgi:hypothetical protein
VKALRLQDVVGSTLLASNRLAPGRWSGESPANVTTSLLLTVALQGPSVGFLPKDINARAYGPEAPRHCCAPKWTRIRPQALRRYALLLRIQDGPEAPCHCCAPKWTLIRPPALQGYALLLYIQVHPVMCNLSSLMVQDVPSFANP